MKILSGTSNLKLSKDIAKNLGIRHVFSGPLVRSSYLAEHVFDALN